jgi:hypothetical protein
VIGGFWVLTSAWAFDLNWAYILNWTSYFGCTSSGRNGIDVTLSLDLASLEVFSAFARVGKVMIRTLAGGRARAGSEDWLVPSSEFATI